MTVKLTSDLIGASYYSSPYYQSDDYKEKLAAAYAMEAARQSLQRKEAAPEALAYARFLNAVENDATLSGGNFKSFDHDDAEIARERPFLAELIGLPVAEKGVSE